MSHNLTQQSAFSSRFKAWMDERFPLKNSILSILVYLSTAFVARSTEMPGEIPIRATDLIGCVVTWSFFFLLRVFDEHKDYDLDVKNHPNRVLQSGLIGLKHLKIAGAICIFLQVVWTLAMGHGFGSAFNAWMIMFGWSCLMAAEFFCGEWLEKRLVLYALSHMLVMFLIGWWVAKLAAPAVNFGFLLASQLLMLFVGGFAFEITRKTRGPEEERETVDSYTKIFGVQGATQIVLGLILTLVLLQSVVILTVGNSVFWELLVLAGVLALTVKQLFGFSRSPSLEMREKNEAMVGVLMLVGFILVIVASCLNRGVTLSFV